MNRLCFLFLLLAAVGASSAAELVLCGSFPESVRIIAANISAKGAVDLGEGLRDKSSLKWPFSFPLDYASAISVTLTGVKPGDYAFNSMSISGIPPCERVEIVWPSVRQPTLWERLRFQSVVLVTDRGGRPLSGCPVTLSYDSSEKRETFTTGSSGEVGLIRENLDKATALTVVFSDGSRLSFFNKYVKGVSLRIEQPVFAPVGSEKSPDPSEEGHKGDLKGHRPTFDKPDP